jgi:ribosomal-protein-alanine N-acetyltransferase
MKQNILLRTKRLRVAPMTDAEMSLLIQNETDAHMKNAYAEMLDGSTAHPEARQWYAAWRISLPDGTPVGDLCFKGVPLNGEVEIGYGIDKTHRGQGYATEAVRAATDWAFSQNGVWFVVAETEPDNAPSQRVMQKAGFSPAGEGKEGPRFEREKPKAEYASLYMCIGMCMGVALGSALSNIAMGLPLGMCLGLALGSYMDAQDKKLRAAAKAARAKNADAPRA